MWWEAISRDTSAHTHEQTMMCNNPEGVRMCVCLSLHWGSKLTWRRQMCNIYMLPTYTHSWGHCPVVCMCVLVCVCRFTDRVLFFDVFWSKHCRSVTEGEVWVWLQITPLYPFIHPSIPQQGKRWRQRGGGSQFVLSLCVGAGRREEQLD